ncbi:RdgB/HAM1 family non-canonical purine NTP pyrophosphatase [Peptoniphilus sp. KCTC 25270]|uniref:RdgB/HAM1 family non-canonical purine NTP pyrophosphatase n=1 Tax=Peptoniphilus sp. KCTC 25270 TaxID=2897414 RepID=UPI001E4B1199|nr:RdgB/HAM1 family non-canonical purine NTP pyrophosphatase [Peptoniphilus sp. KCTC 25270]MCD1147072.1 RdgB/HAM1 family non-canonical purine NTP pyrophosphatase [Peptoniphilus sp. KCTC 25270]
MERKKIVLSSDNQHKIHEIKEILKDLDFEILTKTEAGYGEILVVEDGETLEENAKKKIEAFQDPGTYFIGDDTGLFVEALEGRPGVFSARYAGEECDDNKNRKKLLQELEGTENRKAYFETVLAVKKDQEIHFLKGRCYGTIAKVEKGENGFGYDSLFIPEGYANSFAEMSEDDKNGISHRGNALRELKKFLK